MSYKLSEEDLKEIERIKKVEESTAVGKTIPTSLSHEALVAWRKLNDPICPRTAT